MTMDPNKALANLRELAIVADRSIFSEAAEICACFHKSFTEFDNYLKAGGALPDDWKQDDLKSRILTLGRQCWEATGMQSCLPPDHETYRTIVAIGKPAIPIILEEMLNESHWHWICALSDITGERPWHESSNGKFTEITNAWIKWGTEHKHIQPSNLFRVQIQNKWGATSVKSIDIRAVSKSEIKRQVTHQYPDCSIVQIDQIKPDGNQK
jgi:hypothetical protein